MKKVIFALVLLASATLFAQSPFDGTWMTKLDTAKFPTKSPYRSGCLIVTPR